MSITGPVGGTIAGGYVCSALGGYNDIKTLYAIMFVSLCSVACAMPVAFLTSFWFSVILMWTLLFTGGLMAASMTGIMINCVEHSMKTTANSLANILYNSFGFLPAPFIYGYMIIVGQNGEPDQQRYAMGFLMSMTILTAIFICTSCILLIR